MLYTLYIMLTYFNHWTIFFKMEETFIRSN